MEKEPKMPAKDRSFLKPTMAMRELEKRIAAMPGVRKVNGVRYRSGAVVYFIKPSSFDSLEPSFLFVLGHCIDRRYWKHGPDWRLSVLTNDVDNFASYVLESAPTGGARQVASLVKNIDENMSSRAFVDLFGIKLVADRWRRKGWLAKPRKRAALAEVPRRRGAAKRALASLWRKDVKSRERLLRKSDPA